MLNKEKYELIYGNCLDELRKMPDNSVDCVITSPPYWQQRIYEDSSGVMQCLGNEDSYEQYINNLLEIIDEIHRVLKKEGSFWLNIGDKFYNKQLVGIPWRVAIAMQDRGWILRSDIIWDKMKGTQSCKDRFRDVYEHVFQFAKSKKYYFDSDKIKIKPSVNATVTDKKTVSATGVTGKKYFEMIKKTEFLTPEEKENATSALNDVLKEIRNGQVNDFRMTLRGEQRSYHSNNTKISGRAKELHDKGFYIIKMKSDGFVPSNIWRIVPEDKWRRDAHCAVFPKELLQMPILSTCPENGIVLDPFVGTGSTICEALLLKRRAIGIDISDIYLKTAQKRIDSLKHE